MFVFAQRLMEALWVISLETDVATRALGAFAYVSKCFFKVSLPVCSLLPVSVTTDQSMLGKLQSKHVRRLDDPIG